MDNIEKDSARIFIDRLELKENDSIQLDEENYNYLINVLRLGNGDKVEIFNNSEYIYKSEIIQIDGKIKKVKLIINKREESYSESSIKTILLQGIPKADKLEMIVEKATELGISEIQPIISEHSIKKIDCNKIERLNKISLAAARQSKRSILPEVCNPISTKNYRLKDKEKDTLKLLMTQDGGSNLKDLLLNNKSRRIIFAIGPEGDFSTSEKDYLKGLGFIDVSLGARVLRTELASIIVLGIIQHETGNLQIRY